MLLRYFRARSKAVSRTESGIYLVWLAGILLVLLALVGLAVDSARLYFTRRQLQNAVDAAAVAASNLMVTSPTRALEGDGSHGPTVESMARDLIRENLRSIGYKDLRAADIVNSPICFGPANDISSTNDCVDPSRTTAEKLRGVRIRASTVQPTLILGLIPGFWKSNIVSADSVIQNMRLRVALVLDESSSMGQQMDPLNGDTQTRMFRLKESSSRFLDFLFPFDRAGVIAFSSNYSEPWHGVIPNVSNQLEISNPSTVDERMSNYLNDVRIVQPLSLVENEMSQLKTAVDSLLIVDHTDIAAGIRIGKEVLLDPIPDPVALDEQLVMVVVTDGAPFDDHELLARVNEPPRNMTMICTGSDLARITESNPSFLFEDQTNAAPIATNEDIGPNEQRRRLGFLDAIIEADDARLRGITVYAIGLGQINTNNYNPFQGQADSQHPILLWRIANDQVRMQSPSTAPVDLSRPTALPDGSLMPPARDPRYPWDFPCTMTGQSLSRLPAGQYYSASDGPGLTAAFNSIARQIRGQFAR